MGAIADSGASWHYCPDKDKFVNYHPITDSGITMADGRRFKAIGMGDVPISLPNRNCNMKSVLMKAIHVPDFAFTLISIRCLDKAGCSVNFANSACTI
jgi:hypothetical protein